jgi:hypothetical protein
MRSALMQEKSSSYEPSAINFHLQETFPREQADLGAMPGRGDFDGLLVQVHQCNPDHSVT